MEIRIKIEEKGRKTIDETITLPGSWDEVPPAAYPQLASLYLATEQKMDRYDKTLRTFVLLAGAQAFQLISKLQPEELLDLLPAVDWVFSKLDLKKNLQPSIAVRLSLSKSSTVFLGPADELENLRFAEWCAADTFMVNFSETQDMHELHQLAAVLYRPAGTGDEYTSGHVTYRGDRREKFNDQLLKERTALMATLPDHVIQGIYLFYVSCRKQIIGSYPVTFPEKTEQNKGNAASSWLDIYDDLRADPKYAGENRLDEEMLHSVLFSLERSNIKMNELKAGYDL